MPLCSGHAASPSRTIAAIAAVLCCFCSGTLVGGSHLYSHQTSLDALIGTVCEPPFGYLPLTCGDYELLESRSDPAPIFLYGPNTCRTTRVVRRNVLEYQYRRYCTWAYDRQYYNWVQRCSLICQPTTTCTDRNQTSDLSKFECCEGFQTRAVDKNEYYNYYYQTLYHPVPALPIGCPRAVGVSLLDCLVRQNLTTFLSFLVRSSYFDLLSLNDSNITLTVFAPSNAAFDAANISLGIDPDVLIGNHIVMGTVNESNLIVDRRFVTLEGLILHSTTAAFPDTSSISYYNQPFISVHFINGGRIVNEDACITVNGTLHIIDRVLMPENRTIAEILSSTPRYSSFRNALEAAGTLQFLFNMDISRTIFVPPNDVFDEAIPEALFTCLTAYMRVPLMDLVLHHISSKADYSTTLALQGYIYTLQLSPILIFTDDSGIITLNRDMAAQITVPNIPALNGVIHEIDMVLMPTGFTFGKCQEFAPTTAPPTTPPPTTPPLTTPPLPTTPPPTTTVADSMVTDAPAPGEASGGDGIVGSPVEISDTIDYEANP